MSTTRLARESSKTQDALQPRERQTLLKLIVTPVVFISFLVSLALVDLRNSAKRAHYHAADDDNDRRMPSWLHRVVYRYKPYRYVAADKPGEGQERRPEVTTREMEEEYYHSKQRKLMKMEVQDAFEMRTTVLVVLGLLVMAVAWLAWLGVAAGLRVVRSSFS